LDAIAGQANKTIILVQIDNNTGSKSGRFEFEII
jgi:hypothetical protein